MRQNSATHAELVERLKAMSRVELVRHCDNALSPYLRRPERQPEPAGPGGDPRRVVVDSISVDGGELTICGRRPGGHPTTLVLAVGQSLLDALAVVFSTLTTQTTRFEP